MERLQHIQEMLKSEPDDSFLNYALALEYAKINDINKATQIIEKLLEKEGNYLGAYYQLGKFYEQLEQREFAVTTYKKGIVIAQKLNNKKTLRELNEALMILEE